MKKNHRTTLCDIEAEWAIWWKKKRLYLPPSSSFWFQLGKWHLHDLPRGSSPIGDNYGRKKIDLFFCQNLSGTSYCGKYMGLQSYKPQWSDHEKGISFGILAIVILFLKKKAYSGQQTFSGI